jgi:NAD(P)-dependent dehydrogenase (short-subunit alcohol dehydrogenase family)
MAHDAEVLITGRSSGFGRAAALTFHHSGWNRCDGAGHVLLAQVDVSVR